MTTLLMEIDFNITMLRALLIAQLAAEKFSLGSGQVLQSIPIFLGM